MLLEFALCCGTVALRKPGLDQRGDGVAAFKALRFVVEVKTDSLLQRCDGLTDAASLEVRCILDAMIQSGSNSNAREVRTLFHELVAEHARSLMGIQHPTPQQLRLLTTMAIPARCGAARAIDIENMPPID